MTEPVSITAPTLPANRIPPVPPRTLCIVLHDVAPATLAPCRRLLDALDRIQPDVRVTLLAVPRYHHEPRDAAFEAWLQARARRGDEVALHGFTHLDERPPRGFIDHLRRRHYTRGEGEFSDLPLAEARTRIKAGLRWLRRLGLEPAGFVAPAWLLGPDSWRAVREWGFAYTCTLRQIHPLGAMNGNQPPPIDAQAQVYSNSSSWRRGLSVLWNGSLARRQRRQPVVRLELHPSDIDHPLLVASWQRLAAQQLRSRTARTLADVAHAAQVNSTRSARSACPGEAR